MTGRDGRVIPEKGQLLFNETNTPYRFLNECCDPIYWRVINCEVDPSKPILEKMPLEYVFKGEFGHHWLISGGQHGQT